MTSSKTQPKNPSCDICNIRNHSILNNATVETLHKINEEKRYGRYVKADFLFQAGEKANGFYFIRKGIVRVFKHSTTGKEQTFHIRGPGDWVGFRDSLAGDNYFHSSECLEDVEACFITKELTELLIRDDANFQAEVFRQMAKEWRESENQVVSLGTKQVHSKLAELLITLKKAAGDSNEVELKMTREILASIIGTKTETLVRALTDFKNRDIVQVDKSKIIINDLNALYSLSELEPESATKVS
jgi:CRP/FNR family transcriptional regulator